MALAAVGYAEPIPVFVENFSFELPGTEKQYDWENVPGWNSDTVAEDSGVDSVEHGWVVTDGQWMGFLWNFDPSAYNLIDHTISAGELLILTVDASNGYTGGGGSPIFKMTLYYDDAGSRVPVASQTSTLPGTGNDVQWGKYSIKFNADSVSASIGKKIGIEIENTAATTFTSWLMMDNVRLEGEGGVPKTWNPYPANDAEGISPTVTLTWETSGGVSDPTYNFHFGTDPENWDIEVSFLTEPSYAPPMYYAYEYYWRVDVVDGGETYPGDLWNFSIRERPTDCPDGDLNYDYAVDIEDLKMFAEQWLDEPGCVGYPDGCADLTGNSDGVDMADFVVVAENWLTQGKSAIIINEIHSDPDVRTELIEFVELHNTGPDDVDLSGWYFSDGISYEFPPGTILSAGGHIVVTENPNLAVTPVTLEGKFGVSSGLIYGPFDGSISNNGEKIELCDAAGVEIDQVEYQLGFPWPTVGDSVPVGSTGNGHSMQLLNPSLDNDLGGSWRSAYPTPAAENSAIYTNNIPPQIRQVTHYPELPVSGRTVTITAKVTDPDGVVGVTLCYQIVNPGSYIRIDDSIYNTNWTPLAMHDDGSNGDEFSGDDVYTVQVPGSFQTHRRLIRYRITVEGTAARSVTVPYSDDPQPNFAYFVYDGVPAWTGAIEPGVDDPVEYDTTVMRSLPVYHLISREQDVVNSQYIPGTTIGKYTGSDYPWCGTLIYDGEVYDHIHYRARGGYWRYAMGKNMWKFDFNRGHYFQSRNNYGEEYSVKWDKLNFSACIQHGDFWMRGEHGMFEAVGFKFFNMVGVESSKTNWVQFRVIDEPDESGATQYEGDLWGLYLVLEQMDGRFLDEHRLPDGNLYKMEYWTGELNNQGSTAVTDKSDLNGFMNTYNNTTPTDQWWRDNLDLGRYYSYRSIVEGIHHYDIAYGKNYFYYLNPETDLWSVMPWDLDVTWADYMYGNGQEPFYSRVLPREVFNLGYRNRLREIRDLLFNTDQAHQLIDDLAAVIDDPCGGPSIVDVDRAMWDYNPILISNYVVAGKGGHGKFYESSPTNDFPGMLTIMKNYITSRGVYMDSLAADSDIPFTPVIMATGPPDFPVNSLTFQTSTFDDPQGSGTFAAMKWRIGQVESGSAPPSQNEDIVLISQQETWKYFRGTQEPSETTGAWRELGFNDDPCYSNWRLGQTSIGYGESFIMTPLDMRYNYTTAYLRKEFDVEDPGIIENLLLEVQYDDGVNIWINGTHVVGGNVSSDELPYDATADDAIENLNFVPFTLFDPDSYLVSGTNIITVQVLNANLSVSSDCFIDIRLTAQLYDPGDNPGVYRTGPGKYEIDTVWETGEITSFQSNITIPASEVDIGGTYRVRCRMKDDTGRWSHWSEPVQFETGLPVASPILDDLRITELMFNPAAPLVGSEYDNDDFEFIELKNIGSETLDLTGVSFTDGIDFAFDGNDVTSLDPCEFVLVVGNTAAFQSRYGMGLNDKIAGIYLGRLSNAGERIKLEDYLNGTIHEFDYKDGWYQITDGYGFSLTVIDPRMDPNLWDQKDGWRPGSIVHGSPGADDESSLPDPGDVVINELLAHSHAINPDWIELYNTTAATINIGGWFLSDDNDNLKKYEIPSDTLIAAGGYVVFYEDTSFGVDPCGFALSEDGETLYLHSGQDGQLTGYSEEEDFGPSQTNIAFGRYQKSTGAFNFVAMSANTAGSVNAYPKVGPVVISEIMYHPQINGDAEYVELLNISGSAVHLWTYDPCTASDIPWRFTDEGGITFDFPVGTTMAIDERILLVRNLAAFNGEFPGISGVQIFEWVDGKLDNGGEKIQLSMPGEADTQTGERYYIRVDRVVYSDGSNPVGDDPWPTAPDGEGKALIRKTDSDYGNDVVNWQAADADPGS